jgi:hypothetical protein
MALTVVCPRCGRSVAEILNFAGEIRAAGGTVTEVAGQDGTLRYYQVACSSRRKHFEMRRWTKAVLGGAYGAYWKRPQISMAEIRRGLEPVRGFQGSGDGGPRGDSTGLSFGNGR